MKDRRPQIASWCLYDWANSAFTTLVVTFVYATYFSQSFADDPDQGTALWSRGIVVSSLFIAVLSPIFGAIADRGGTRRRYLAISTLVCVAGSAVLAFLKPGDTSVWLVLGVFVVANVAFEVGMVFYNAFLPAITPPETIGRVSGYGWGLGYAGGLLCLVLALFGFIGLGGDPWLSLPQEDGFHVRATNLLVAGWFLLFSLPMLLLVKDRPVAGGGPQASNRIGDAVGDLGRTLTAILRFPEIVRFLIARLIYNDGLVTIFAFGGIYAAGTFGMEVDEVIVFGIALNVTAGLGAWMFGFIDDRIGGKATVLISLVALSAATILAVIAPSKPMFWIAGLLLGIFIGPNQAASRSLMARLVPERHQTEFFGFFAFSGKATAFLGPLLLGLLSAAFGQRMGVAVVILFFVVGAILLVGVDERRGIERAEQM